jgi:hypothetical protein
MPRRVNELNYACTTAAQINCRKSAALHIILSPVSIHTLDCTNKQLAAELKSDFKAMKDTLSSDKGEHELLHTLLCQLLSNGSYC